MNGAESLVRTLVVNDVEVSFSNPGTSAMHCVAALDKVEGVRHAARTLADRGQALRRRRHE